MGTGGRAVITARVITARVITARTSTIESPRTIEKVEDRADAGWITVVWNDPVNLMNYVSWVFRSYFGFTPQRAERLMLTVHTAGRAVVASGGREEMERHVEALHDFGLWATLAPADA